MAILKSPDSNAVSIGQSVSSPGPFLAVVVGHLDPTSMGILAVEILRPGSGNANNEGEIHQVQYMSPFYGVTGEYHTLADPNDYGNTQKSYGMWMIPPDPGTTVIVIFIDGDPKRGYWIGCVMDKGMNFMVPGLAATAAVVEPKAGRVPVAEYNKKVAGNTVDATKVKKPTHPFAVVLTNQGLVNDDIRGITSSSARREAPSMVFGISTPGPIDKRQGAKRGPIGPKGSRVTNAYVSRLGGSTFVMDDGDDKFIRKGPASSASPIYAAIEQGETGGNNTIPHNELVRIRTRTGHQILLHNSEDLIYIGNAGGTAWVELTSNGKIDIYAKDSISVRTANDINFTADRDINFNAAGDINFNAGINFNCTAVNNYNIIAGRDGKLSTGGSSNINAVGNHVETAARIHMNGPLALIATPAKLARRAPQVEPWAEHENLDPVAFNVSKNGAIINPLILPPATTKGGTTIGGTTTGGTTEGGTVSGGVTVNGTNTGGMVTGGTTTGGTTTGGTTTGGTTMDGKISGITTTESITTGGTTVGGITTGGTTTGGKTTGGITVGGTTTGGKTTTMTGTTMTTAARPSVPVAFKQYTTKTDTFAQVKGAEK